MHRSEIVLVTGAAGLVGRSVTRSMGNAGFPVRAAVRAPGGSVPGATQVVYNWDLEAPETWGASLDGVDAVVHLAARAHRLGDGPSAAPLYRAVNVIATARLARAAAQRGVRRFVLLSSIGVFGETSPGRPLLAGDQELPESDYARSKSDAEHELAVIAAECGIEVAVIRAPLVYGPGAPGNLDRLLRLVARGWPIPLGAVKNRRTLVSVESLADLIRAAVRAPGARGAPLLAGDRQPCSTPDLLRWIGEGLEMPVRLVSVPVPVLKFAGSMLGRRRSVEKLVGSLEVDVNDSIARTGWRPIENSAEGIKAMAAAFKGRG